MPRKKKTSSKKKRSETADENRRAYVDEGRKDAKGLARACPDIAQALKRGEIDANDVARRLVLVDVAEEHKSHTLPLKDNPNKKEDYIQAFIAALNQLALPMTMDIDKSFEFYRELHANVYENMFHGEEVTVSALEIQEAFDATCEKWEARIGRLTGRPLKETCHLYKITPEAFITFFEEFLTINFDTSAFDDPELKKAVANYKEVKRAAQGIIDGEDVIKRTCWECRQESTCIQECSLCKAARYCARECQVKSWKEGHKKACKELKITYERFKDNQERVYMAIQEGVCGIQPTPSFDFRLVPMMLDKHEASSVLGLPPFLLDSFHGPSMDIFYRNLAAIINGGEHWLFPDTPNTSLASGSFKNESIQRPASHDEFLCCLLITLTLSYDTSRSTSNLSDDVVKALILSHAAKVVGSGRSMTAKRFLQLYSTMSVHMKDAKRGVKEARSESATRALKIMIEEHHKKN